MPENEASGRHPAMQTPTLTPCYLSFVSGHHNAFLVAAVGGELVMSTTNGLPITERERLLIAVASDMVRAWLLDPNRLPFRRALLTQAEEYLLLNGLTRADYPEFRLLANAIRTGKGHAVDNPGPLLAILRSGIHHRI